MNSLERFNEEKLRARRYFFSSTKKGKTGDDDKTPDGHISVKDYLMCEKNCDKCNMKNMCDYHDHYLKKYVLFMADVFEKFVSTCLKFYGLDPCLYFSIKLGCSCIKLGCYVKNDWCKIRKIIRH